MPYIKIVNDSRNQRYKLNKDTFILGRDPRCDLPIPDVLVSRHHAVIEKADSRWSIRDLKSTNRILINGQSTSAAELSNDDIIGIGSFRLRFSTSERSSTGAFTSLDDTDLSPDTLQDTGGARLRLFVDLAAALSSYEKPKELIQRCGQILVHLFQPYSCLVQIGQEVWTNRQAAITPEHRDVTGHALTKIGEQDSALLFDQEALAVDSQLSKSVEQANINSVMGAPIHVEQSFGGVICVDQRTGKKPFDREDLYYLVAVSRFISAAVTGSNRLLRLLNENHLLHSSKPRIIGDSPEMAKLRQMIEQRIGPANSNVLLLGETGTGKTMIAEAIHLCSERAKGPLVEVNCAAIPKDLFESEMFGHRKGAFSGAHEDKPGQFSIASGGTILLDEVGELDPSSQTKLLHVIQNHKCKPVGDIKERPVDIRIIAATNRDLAQDVAHGRFRSDLFYRLNVVSLTLPPLKERSQDIPKLVDYFLHRIYGPDNRDQATISDAAQDLLLSHSWPGNVRELNNCLERAAIFSNHRPLDVEHFDIRQAPHPGLQQELNPVEQAELEMVLDALQKAGGNKSKASRFLGWYPQKLYNRLKRYGI